MYLPSGLLVSGRVSRSFTVGQRVLFVAEELNAPLLLFRPDAEEEQLAFFESDDQLERLDTVLVTVGNQGVAHVLGQVLETHPHRSRLKALSGNEGDVDGSRVFAHSCATLPFEQLIDAANGAVSTCSVHPLGFERVLDCRGRQR